VDHQKEGTLVKPAAFAFHRPASLEEAAALLASLGEDASVLSGGQSLIPMMNLRLAQPEALIDIGGIPGLGHIRVEADHLVVGARVTHHELATYPIADGVMDAFREAAGYIGHLPIRSRGTFGGSLAHADSKAEWCVLALALGGEVVLHSTDGTRTLGLDGYFVGPYQTARRSDEVVVEARLRRPSGAALDEHATRHGDFASAIVAVSVDLAADGRVATCRLAVGGVTGTPVRSAEAEVELQGQRPEATVRSRVAATLAGSLPSAGVSPALRQLVAGLAERSLERAVDRASRWNGGGA
jgi:carbon-monoxide dehydrogenase medium subunit